MKTSKLLLRAGIAVAALAAAPQAQALNFILTDIGGAGVGTSARQGFQIAANYWSSVLTDTATVNLRIGFSALDPGVLGQAGSASALVSINQVYNALALDATTAVDALALANLPTRGPGLNTASGPTGSVAALANGFLNGVNPAGGYSDLTTRLDNDQSINNDALAITKASAKALGLTRNVNNALINYASADAEISFSTRFSFDFDPRDGITAGSFDFIGVAIHEIGHALGFISGVDTVDFFTGPGNPDPVVRDAAGNPIPTGLENFVVMSQLDLFRYSAASRALGVLDWTTQGVPYFSLDGGATQLFGDSRFSTGTENGDGQQASHWKDNGSNTNQIGIMDPNIAPGQRAEVRAADLAAFDAIGWNSNVNALANPGYRFNTAEAYNAFLVASGVPEPTTWAMMIAGFGLVGGAMRRRSTKVAFAA